MTNLEKKCTKCGKTAKELNKPVLDNGKCIKCTLKGDK